MKQAMILAAGLGKRMQPLTEKLPKPLLQAGGKPLLQYHLEALGRAAVSRVVINHARLGGLIEQRFGDGSQFGLEIVYSPEGEVPLETGGGIRRALTLLHAEAFICVNADIWTDFDFSRLPDRPAGLGHLVLVDNPPHHPRGDFSLSGTAIDGSGGGDRLTFSGISVLTPALFAGAGRGAFPLAPLLFDAAAQGRLSGEYFAGRWYDIGTPARLQALDRQLSER